MEPATGAFDPEGDFARAYAAGEPRLLSRLLVADLETPVSAFLKLSHGRAGNIFLLESVEGGATRGRYSMIGLDPDVVWRCTGPEAEIDRDALSGRGRFVPCPGAPLDALRALLAESAIPARPGDPPMAAGVFGYLGYDMVRHMERLPAAKPDPIGVPDAVMIRPTAMVVFDAVRDEIAVVTPVRPRPGVSARAAHAAASERLEAVVGVLEGPLVHAGPGADPRLLATPPQSNTGTPAFLAMVERAKDYIRAGDIFQVVLSQRFFAPFALPPFALYRALRRVNPAPFLCYLDFGGFQICCSSPEILVRVRDGLVTIRPIAGTDSFFVERYSHVMHIVSNVVGRLAAGHDVIDALAAGFPAGTVSGAPKVRAMEIIDELEREKRGIYGGCIGYFGAGGEMDTCIVLRTSVIKDGVMHVQAGAGIVYDSVPESEDAECANKARALVRAAEEAVRFASASRRGQ